VRLPASLPAIQRWRAQIDAAALRSRYTDARLNERYQPAAGARRKLFDMLEQNRVEALGARQYPGVRINLATGQELWNRNRPEAVAHGGEAETWVETFALLTRVPLGAPLPEAAIDALAKSWRAWVTDLQALEIERLAVNIHDQDAFARQALLVVDSLLGSTAATGVPEHEEHRLVERTDSAKQPSSENSAERGAPGGESRKEGVGKQILAGAGAAGAAGSTTTAAAYHAFTDEFDSVVTVEDLYSVARLTVWRQELDRLVAGYLPKVTQLARRLQRKLLGLHDSSWQFEQEEGLLDTGRLTKLVTQPLDPLVYMRQIEAPFAHTVVSLLIDNSGSMQGRPIATAAICAELLGCALERCGVKTEVLGFTTGAWRGGRPRQQWIASGRPARPGRLTELRHIIYKTAGQTWRQARPRLGAMLDENLLKENVDGEAVLWAASRLQRRDESRKLLIVISDGAPFDEATLDANDSGYLGRHLRSVVRRIEAGAEVQIAAIGIGHDVASDYPQAVTVKSIDELGEALVERLMTLFDSRRR
jgi:cobaltochelatase CobT